MLDGHMWWELRKAGEPEKKVMTPKRKAADLAWLQSKIRGSTDA